LSWRVNILGGIMIKRWSIYFGAIAAIVVGGLGLYVGVSFDTIIIRMLIVFFAFYLLGNLLGVITIESLLENQEQKVKRKLKEKQDE